MDDLVISLADILRWITIGQSALSALVALGLAIYALRYFAKGRAWRRFVFMATFAPSYMAMFIYIATDLHTRMGRGLSWRLLFGFAIFTVADYAMLVLFGHLMVRRESIYEEIRNFTIFHDPHIEFEQHRNRKG